jgi:crotonobetainyl-CoA:carnitine CoA-transferase CaiB-like acyl-CoA transferase
VRCEHPVAKSVRIVGPPLRMSETPGTVRTPAPLLGEHTDTVLRERLGVSDDDLAALRRAGVIGPEKA